MAAGWGWPIDAGMVLVSLTACSYVIVQLRHDHDHPAHGQDPRDIVMTCLVGRHSRNRQAGHRLYVSDHRRYYVGLCPLGPIYTRAVWVIAALTSIL